MRKSGASMITRIIKVEIKENNKADFLAYMGDFVKEVREFKNIQHFDFFEDKEISNHFHLYSIWKTNGALAKFRNADLNKELVARLEDYGEKPYAAWTVENVF